MKRWALVGTLALAACEAPLDPIAPSGLHFSLSGYLDASSDTQWVRVEPLAPTADPTTGPIDAEVALVLPDGDRQRMAQEVRIFPTGPAHLFWTTAPVEPGRTYRVVARATDGSEARTDVAIPDDADVTLTLVDGLVNCPTAVLVGGAVTLVDVEARYELRGEGRVGQRFRFDKAASVRRGIAGTLDAFVYFGDDALAMRIPGLPGEYPVLPEIVVALGTDDWPDTAGLSLEDALGEVSLGRVEGGVGFVGGTVTKTLPFVPGFGVIPPFEGSGIDPEPCYSDPDAVR